MPSGWPSDADLRQLGPDAADIHFEVEDLGGKATGIT